MKTINEESRLKVASIIKENSFPNDKLETGQHMETIVSLLRHKDDDILDKAFGMKQVLQEVMGILTNPKISSKLSDYAQENCGKYLNELIDFYDSVTTYDKEFQAFYDYSNLKIYGIEGERLNDILERNNIKIAS
jgi:hypothetical protein